MDHSANTLSRRRFIKRGIGGVSIWALGTAALAKHQDECRGASGDSAPNPFAYDVDRLGATEPKLVKYEQVRIVTGLEAEARRMAIGPQDYFYIAAGKGVQTLDETGGPLAQIPLSSPARCVAVSEDGMVYVGVRTHVEVFNAKGQPIATWEAPSHKTWLTGLSVGANDLFAADSANRVILRYDRSGKLIGRIGEKNQQRDIAGLIVPSPYLDVKLGRDGLLRVNNPGRHRVDVFTAGGDLEFSWGKPSAAIEGFCGCCNPIGLAVLPDGRCVTCEKGLPRVKVYSVERTLDCVVAGPELFRQNGRAGQISDRADGTLGGLDAAIDSHGNVCILDLVAGNIRVMRPKA